MSYDEVIQHYGSQAATARALNIKQASVAEWKQGIPLTRQFQIEVLTEGVLRADRPQPEPAA